ncbi:hypothetical protein CALCODRAFT_484232 [Calocera cornea HHB12733]|uniref:Uncharacterized protein n=1 Tax=Calocera cornea HHB12733 TaxID=1353952 RepID=A0A165F3H2_9BASI|nr:hypothetical protein CALCODRAFT_484232 [Calocera cornea HHB12733]
MPTAHVARPNSLHPDLEVRTPAWSQEERRCNSRAAVRNIVRKHLQHLANMDPSERKQRMPSVNSLIGEINLRSKYDLLLHTRKDEGCTYEGTFPCKSGGESIPGHPDWQNSIQNTLSDREHVDCEIQRNLCPYRAEPYNWIGYPDWGADEDEELLPDPNYPLDIMWYPGASRFWFIKPVFLSEEDFTLPAAPIDPKHDQGELQTSGQGPAIAPASP